MSPTKKTTIRSEQARRLRLARTAAGYTSAAQAAGRNVWNPTVYGKHENGERGYFQEREGKPAPVVKYAETFGVSENWLRDGDDLAGAPAVASIVHVEALDGSDTTSWPFPAVYLRDELRREPDTLRTALVRGHEMTPTLSDGDLALVDTSDVDTSVAGVFALDDGGNAFRNVSRVLGSDPVEVKLGGATDLQTVTLDAIRIVGRVVWVGKRL